MNSKPEASRAGGEGGGGSEATESALRELTSWKGPLPRPGLWERAMEEAATGETEQTPSLPLLRRRIPTALAAVLAVAAIGVLVTAMMPSLGRGRAPVRSMTSTYAAVEESARRIPPAAAADVESFSVPGEPSSQHTAATLPAERSVIRKATIEIRAADVHVSAKKVTLLVNDGAGEFVQESSVRGEGEQATAQLVLRVSAGRLSGVLDSIRALGEVTDESASGTDVTGQVVDLEARLRNEQRVETELLDLLERRKAAPLGEILDLREQIARVRSEIERLVGQRDQLSRLVSLATVHVVIRGSDQPDQGAAAPILPYFGDRLEAAWHSGTRALADTLAFLVRVAVGGLLWWIMAAAGLILALRHPARSRRAAASARGYA